MEQHERSVTTSSKLVLNVEALQNSLQVKASSEWFKDKPELLSIFEEFIKTPKEIDLTRKYERREENTVLDNSQPIPVEYQRVSPVKEKENYYGIKKSNLMEKPKIKKAAKKKTVTNDKPTGTLTNPDNLENHIEIVSQNMENTGVQSTFETVNSNTAEYQPQHEKDTMVTKSKVKQKKSPSKPNPNKQKQDKKKRKHNEDKLAHQTKKFKPVEPKEPPVKDFCKFYLHGNCYKGDSCPFSHDKKSFPCKFFHLYNSCKKGDGCEFSHQTPLSDAYRTLLQNTEKKFSESSKEDAESKLASSNPLPFPKFESVSNPSPSPLLEYPSTQPTIPTPFTIPTASIPPLTDLSPLNPLNIDSNTKSSSSSIPSAALPFSTLMISNPFTQPQHHSSF